MEDRARILEDRVEDLTRTIANTINEAEVPERPEIRAELRDFAINLLKESVVPPEPVVVGPADGGATFNPLAMGIPVFFAGGVLIFLFPPVGMMLFAASVVLIVWGLATSMMPRRR